MNFHSTQHHSNCCLPPCHSCKLHRSANNCIYSWLAMMSSWMAWTDVWLWLPRSTSNICEEQSKEVQSCFTTAAMSESRDPQSQQSSSMHKSVSPWHSLGKDTVGRSLRLACLYYFHFAWRFLVWWIFRECWGTGLRLLRDCSLPLRGNASRAQKQAELVQHIDNSKSFLHCSKNKDHGQRNIAHWEEKTERKWITCCGKEEESSKQTSNGM